MSLINIAEIIIIHELSDRVHNGEMVSTGSRRLCPCHFQHGPTRLGAIWCLGSCHRALRHPILLAVHYGSSSSLWNANRSSAATWHLCQLLVKWAQLVYLGRLVMFKFICYRSDAAECIYRLKWNIISEKDHLLRRKYVNLDNLLWINAIKSIITHSSK